MLDSNPVRVSVRQRLAAFWRAAVEKDAVAVLLYLIAVVVMTYPLVRHLDDHLPGYLLPDQFSAYWQNWSLWRTLVEGLPINHSPYLFHPHGLDTSVQPRRWMGLITHLPFAFLFGPVAAFNLEGMLGLWISAYAGYRLVLLRVSERVAAWMGGAFIAFYPQHVVRGLARPNTGHIEWLVVFAYLLVRTLDRVPELRRGPRTKYAAAVAGTGLVAAFNAYVNLKIFILAGLMALVYVVAHCVVLLAVNRPNIWAVLAAALGIGACAMLFASPVYIPMATTDWLDHAIDQFGLGRGVDLAAYVVDQQPLPPFVGSRIAMLMGLDPGKGWLWGRFYIGLVSLFLVVFGLARGRPPWRQTVPWVVVALCFFGLSLGTTLHIMGTPYKAVPMPYAWAAKSALFRALRHPHRMPLVFLVAWGVLVGCGASALITSFKKRSRLSMALPGILLVLMLTELSVYPFKLLKAEFSPLNTVLAQGPAECAVIDLPLGRQASKEWMFQQTEHGLPIVEGMAARMPPNAYRYIRHNRLLRWFAGRRPFSCARDMQAAIADLRKDGFCYILVHDRHRWDDVRHLRRMAPLFRNAEPMYRDDDVTAYRLDDLLAMPACPAWKR